MQIRRILLLSFFLLLSIVALPLVVVSLISSRVTLENEIGRNLTSDATMLMEEVDMMMFERIQNVHSWSRLDIIQDIRIGDVDKRLSQFFTDVESGYKGMYRHLFCTDVQQRVIAASTPSLIGSVFGIPTKEVKVGVPSGQVFIEALHGPPLANLVVRAEVHDQFSLASIGQLYAMVDMDQLFRLLDNASRSNSGDRFVVLLDAEGRTIATSSSLRTPQFLLKKNFANWKPDKSKAVFVHQGDPDITTSPVLVGYASSNGYLGYVKMGWSLLVFQSTSQAFLPIRTLWVMFSVVIALTMLLAFASAHWVSGRIANPLRLLTQWIREVRYSENQPLPQIGGAIEIRELEKAFGDMLLELKRSREQVIQAAKLAVIGEMSAIMAHEVRTPLGILLTSAQWLQREQGLSPEGKEMTQFILDESARLNRLITTLLECARPRVLQMQRLNIHKLIAHTVELLAIQADKKNIQIEKQLKAKNPFIFFDSELLTQVFLNLLLNAIQILPVGGRIRIKTISFEQHLGIEIADNGTGIAGEDYPRLFDPFFTKREGGIGLGLTVTQQIVIAHKGKIFATQSEWGGACFNIQLPITQE